MSEHHQSPRDEVLTFTYGSPVKTYQIVDPRGVKLEPGQPVEPVGKGGSGIVFRAAQLLHEGVSIDRAIKFFFYRDDIAGLTQHRYTSPVSKDQVSQEISNITRLNHEHLVKVVDAGICERGGFEIPYIVTEFIEGPTLQDVIDAPPSESPTIASALKAELIATPTRILERLLQIGRAVQHIHSQSFAHCDIKPSNIFVHATQALGPVVGDLGIAKDLRRRREKVFVAGSKKYMPPEALSLLNEEAQWDDFLKLQPYWDIYGFATTAIALLDALSPAINTSWIGPLRKSLELATHKGKFTSIQALLDCLEFLLPIQREIAAVPELSTSVSGRGRRLMPVEALNTSPRTNKLVRHPAILRLAKVPQLTTVYQLFPGANHNRYEHSLGVMETVRRYILALLDEQCLPRTSHRPEDRACPGLRLAIEHYPVPVF